jgi:hypothetical protein
MKAFDSTKVLEETIASIMRYGYQQAIEDLRTWASSTDVNLLSLNNKLDEMTNSKRKIVQELLLKEFEGK